MLKLKPAPIISRKKRMQERAKVQQGINARKEEILTFSVDKETYQKFLIGQYPVSEKKDILESLKLYEKEKAHHELSDENLIKFDRIDNYLQKNKGDKLFLMNVSLVPTCKIIRQGRIRLMEVEIIHTYQPDPNGDIVQAGSIAYISAGDLYNQGDQKGFLLGNSTKGEVISEYSQVLEVEKKVEVVKIQKQEVNSGISLKKIEKELQKIEHILLKKYPENVVKDMLETVFNHIKDL